MTGVDVFRRRVLVLEDEGAVAIDVTDELQRAGYRVAGPFTRCDSALDWLSSNRPDLAVVDLVLSDGPCTAIVHSLREQFVPFVVFSGGEQDLTAELKDALEGVPVVRKPSRMDTLISALARL